MIRSEEVPNEGSCRVMCYMEPDCVSINVRPSQGGKYICELNNATVDENQLTFLHVEGDAYYLAIEVTILPFYCYYRRIEEHRIAIKTHGFFFT